MSEQTGGQEGGQEGTPATKEAEPTKIPITVDGKVEHLTQDELIVRAQKGTAAEGRMQAAKAMHDRAAYAEGVIQSLQSMEKNFDEGHFIRVAQAAGMDQVKMNEVIQNFRNSNQETADKTAAAPVPQRPAMTGFRDLDPTLQAVNSEVYWDLVDRRLEKELDNDAVLCKIKDAGVRAEALKIAREKVVQKSRGQTVRPAAMKQALLETGQLISRLGTQLDSSTPPGSGKAPGSSSPNESTELPDRVPMSDPRYNDVIQQRLEHFARESAAKSD